LSERQRLTFRRFSGLDRSGPPPPATLPGAPLNPWTIPNGGGFVRALLIPAFLIVAFSSDDGEGFTQALLFFFVSWGDQLDGMAARLTGQYSRLGAMLDPVLDRVLILSGVVVCFHFELLPRWALLVMVAREALFLAAGPVAVRRGVELRINWPGRWSVWPLMAGVGLALLGGADGWDTGVFLLGMALSLWASERYIADARRQLAARQSAP